MAFASPYQCLAYSILILPPLFLVTFLLSAFPTAPNGVFTYQNLDSLPQESRSWSVYPKDFYPGGNDVVLPYGKVRYWLMGPESGKKIALVHGLSIPAIIWKDLAPELASRGYRVLLYDLYGRGYSDAPRTTYDSALYVTQLALLMQHVKWEGADIICGLSMGGAITAAFNAHFPNLVKEGVVLISSAGLMSSKDYSRTSKFMASPIIQTLASTLPVQAYLQRMASSSPPPVLPSLSPLVEIVRIQSAHLPGYNAALSSSLRDGPVRGLEKEFGSEHFNGKKVLVIHGTADTTVKYKYASMIILALPEGANKTLVTVENGGHDLPVSEPKRILDAMGKYIL